MRAHQCQQRDQGSSGKFPSAWKGNEERQSDFSLEVKCILWRWVPHKFDLELSCHDFWDELSVKWYGQEKGTAENKEG